jgi:hypothetical protein
VKNKLIILERFLFYRGQKYLDSKVKIFLFFSGKKIPALAAITKHMKDLKMIK